MRQLSACLSVAAMLFALVSAPLFHVHEEDDHGHPGSLIHAHLPEPEQQFPHAGPSIESTHSHDHVQWLDGVFTMSSPIIGGGYAVAEISEPFSVPVLVVTRGFLSVQILHAHGPPERFGLIPRSPPAV
jgi:hypothetical protein